MSCLLIYCLKVKDTTVEQSITVSEQKTVEDSMSNLSLQDTPMDEKLLAKKELWSILKEKTPAMSVDIETIDYEDLQAAISSIKLSDNENKSTNKSEQPVTSKPNDEQSNSSLDEENSSASSNDEEADQYTSDEDLEQDMLSEDEYYKDLNDTEEDELLEEDMLIMQDYLEHIDCGDDDDIDKLLSWPGIEDDSLEVNLYDYATLDEPAPREIPIMEEEEAKITKRKGKKALNAVDESTRKKTSHRTRDDTAVVDPEIFGQTLKAALADVPPGLRPGMRRWYEKQQRKEDRKKKKDEAKALRKQKKQKNGKGKAQDMEDQDLTNQMAKIDE